MSLSILAVLAVIGGLINAYEESQKNRPVTDWTTADVASWLTKLEPSFAGYAEQFRTGAINGRALVAMDDRYVSYIIVSSDRFLYFFRHRTMELIGVSSAAHRLRISAEIRSVSASRL